jgi:hypothetical protein
MGSFGHPDGMSVSLLSKAQSAHPLDDNLERFRNDLSYRKRKRLSAFSQRR